MFVTTQYNSTGSFSCRDIDPVLQQLPQKIEYSGKAHC